MKKVLFIDRDGTIIIEPTDTEQIDTLEKLEFLPNSISALKHIKENADFEFSMVTNQDGLGTASFPEENFQLVQNKMLNILKNEQITFDDIFIDKSFAEENCPTRKPGTAMLQKYFSEEYDLANSYVIGDRITDVELAKNLGAKAIWINDRTKVQSLPNDLKEVCELVTTDWVEIAQFLTFPKRTSEIKRKTNETDIYIHLNLDGSGKSEISTGLHFFDHMLEQLSRHSNCDMIIKVNGDLHVDEHHTMEDTAIALGEAFLKALGNKNKIERYGFLLPMDECLTQVAIDFSGRPWLVWDVEFKREKIGDTPTEMFYHFFKSFSDASKCNLNIQANGTNEHHKIEAVFKATAKAIKGAVYRNISNKGLPSTKGLL
jgi:imidazoleglycerol-phosphate dehydratase / histidinol-phosphatase